MVNKNSFWVLYGQHTQPTYLEDAGGGQQEQRDSALNYVTNGVCAWTLVATLDSGPDRCLRNLKVLCVSNPIPTSGNAL